MLDRGQKKPVACHGDLHSLPATLAPLKALPNWVCWKWHWKIDKKGNGKWDKPPYQPRNVDRFARNNDPSTWGTYEQALAAFEAGNCDGIGFNLSGTELGAFDIDDCRDPESGLIAVEAAAIVDRANSYTEVTVSGTGLRVIGRSTGCKLHRRQRIAGSAVELETYRSAERYIVVTGNPLANAPLHLADISAVSDAVVAELDKPELGGGRRESGVRREALPPELDDLVDRGVAVQEDGSAAFHRAVCWMHDLGFNEAQIERRIVGKPIVPERYADRLAGEISRCISKAKPARHQTGLREPEVPREPMKPAIELLWHGQHQARVARDWLIKDLIPQRGHGLASGQWGAAKTFVMVDLACAVMTATPFAGRGIARQGGVLFIAAEGAGEIPVRLQGVVENKLRGATLAAAASGSPTGVDLDRLPFAWIEETPSLKDDDVRIKLAALAAANHLRQTYDLPLALIIIDTLNAAAHFKDGNDAAEGQFVMNRMSDLSKATGAFVLAVDHFGKTVETGTRGTSAKEAAADVVLALLADKDVAGNISNTRMAVRKLRGGSTGAETPFNLRVVDAGQGETTCVIEWQDSHNTASSNTSQKERWTRSLRIFRAAMATALADHGCNIRPYGFEGAEVKAVADSSVRAEFMARYAVDADSAVDKTSAKRKAFNRSIGNALERSLIAAREVSGIDYLWFVDDRDMSPTRDGRDTS